MTEAEKASLDAAASGQPVEVVSRRQETSDTWALPDGTFSVRQYGSVVRVLQEGVWVDADPTLVFAADGSVVPKATSVGVQFSGGGTGPMVTGVQDGRTLSLTWTKPLPVPTLEGNVATYAEVLPGVDLQLKAEVESFSQLLIVKTPEAAANSELDQLRFTTDTVGLSLSKDAETGMLVATDAVGQEVFTSTAPAMWDSPDPSTGGMSAMAMAMQGETAEPPNAFEPSVGSTEVVMPTALSGDVLTITPDQQLLQGQDTTYPVYIDPEIDYGEMNHWAWIHSLWPNNSYWDKKEVARVGYEAETGGKSRSFFQMNLGAVANADVTRATFRIKNTWSWSCQARPVELWEVNGISRATTWNKPPVKVGTVLNTVNDSKGWIAPGAATYQCDAGNLEFDATRAVAPAAKLGAPNITLGLYANEGDTSAWKKFDPKTAALEIHYNTAPPAPDQLGTSPYTPCTVGGAIGNTSVSLHARVRDEETGNLTAEFELDGTQATPKTYTMPGAINGRVVTVLLPAADTPTGTYTWRVRALDKEKAPSAWSPTCKFTIDRTRPSKPPTITSADGPSPGLYPPGNNGWPITTGPSRNYAKFSFGSNTADGVKAYVWWTDTDPKVHETPVTKPTVTTYVASAGPHLIYAYGVDAAGNRSDTATYLYYANRASKERDADGDLNGDKFADIWSVDRYGALITYSGQGRSAFSAAVNGGQLGESDAKSFPDEKVSYGGDWGEDGYNDLVALEYNATDNSYRMGFYTGAGSGVIDPNRFTQFSVVAAMHNHWSKASQIAVTDTNNDKSPDILVKEGEKLWHYQGSRQSNLSVAGRPTLVGGLDWDKFTIAAPGDINGDGRADLLLREDATGDLYRSYGSLKLGKFDYAQWGAAASRTKVATGLLPKSKYTSFGTPGDFDGQKQAPGATIVGDGIIDLWARKADNTVTGWHGTGTSTSLTGFGTSFTIDGIIGGARLFAGSVIAAGESITSRSNTLAMGVDGNLVVKSKAGKILWSTKTAGNSGAFARVERDGNITVRIKDREQPLWSSGAVSSTADGFAVLHDRGDLIAYDAKGQSFWSSGTSVRHDYNNDGRSDVATWYDYSDGHDEILALTTNSDGKFDATVHGWESPAGNYWAGNMKRVTGDFNGDGVGDIAAFYGKEDGEVSLRTWLGKGDGKFGEPVISWKVDPGDWNFEAIHAQSGDFNGDGRDDVAVWYDYGDGSDRLFTFLSNVRGGFSSPLRSFYRAGGWYTSNMKFATGDYNGDGRDDIGVFYGYDDGDSRLFSFIAKPTGAFNDPSFDSWSSSNWGSLERTSVHSGDFNGDGRDDIATWYDYGDGHDAVISFNPSGPSGSFGNLTEIWNAKAGDYWRQNMKIVTGDFNGDGRDDIGAMYGYANAANSVQMFTWATQVDGTLGGRIDGWRDDSGNWTFDRVRMIERYSPA
ncbi:FG-GAP-like repeat-containing protein [Streptomyces zaomyceticus]|uniref:FG-GAP-like repeat-containing protein n=1 Tax=Streptomyces zaomyceticus TaxID=68286 RepID=UPI0035DFC1F2